MFPKQKQTTRSVKIVIYQRSKVTAFSSLDFYFASDQDIFRTTFTTEITLSRCEYCNLK